MFLPSPTTPRPSPQRAISNVQDIVMMIPAGARADLGARNDIGASLGSREERQAVSLPMKFPQLVTADDSSRDPREGDYVCYGSCALVTTKSALRKMSPHQRK